MQQRQITPAERWAAIIEHLAALASAASMRCATAISLGVRAAVKM
jgi:hypothetical protein